MAARPKCSSPPFFLLMSDFVRPGPVESSLFLSRSELDYSLAKLPELIESFGGMEAFCDRFDLIPADIECIFKGETDPPSELVEFVCEFFCGQE